MSSKSIQQSGSKTQKERKVILSERNSMSYIVIGLCFMGLLILSAANDYLFFGWLSICAFIVFTLIGMHFIGQKQIKKI